jgi:hypothetical protein
MGFLSSPDDGKPKAPELEFDPEEYIDNPELDTYDRHQYMFDAAISFLRQIEGHREALESTMTATPLLSDTWAAFKRAGGVTAEDFSKFLQGCVNEQQLEDIKREFKPLRISPHGAHLTDRQFEQGGVAVWGGRLTSQSKSNALTNGCGWSARRRSSTAVSARPTRGNTWWNIGTKSSDQVTTTTSATARSSWPPFAAASSSLQTKACISTARRSRNGTALTLGSMCRVNNYPALSTMQMEAGASPLEGGDGDNAA